MKRIVSMIKNAVVKIIADIFFLVRIVVDVIMFVLLAIS